MNFALKQSVKIFIIGLVILIIAYFIIFKFSYDTVVNTQLEQMIPIVKKISLNIEQHILEKVKTASTITLTPLVLSAVNESNAQYSALSQQYRDNEIQSRDEKWKTTDDSNDSFILEYTDNPLAQYLKELQINMEGEYGELFITNKYGALVASTAKLTTFAHGHKYWWKGGYSDGDGAIFFDDRGYDDSVGGYVLGVVVPIKNGNDIIGILKINLNILGSIGEIISNSTIENYEKLELIRSGGLVVFEEGVEPLSIRVPTELTEKIRSGDEASYIFTEQGDKWIVGLSEIGLTSNIEGYNFGGSFESIDHKKGNTGESWYIIDYLPLSKIIIPVKHNLTKLLLIGFLLASALAITAFIIGKQAAQPIKELVRQTRQISKGDFDSRVSIKRNDEIGLLAVSFNQMAKNLNDTTTSIDKLSLEIEERKKVEEALQKSEKELQLTLDATTDGIWTWNFKTDKLYFSPKYYTMLGYEPNEFESNFENWAKLIHPDDREKALAVAERYLKMKPDLYKNEFRMITKTGDYLWIHAYARIVERDEKGNAVYMIGNHQDITERKQAEEELKINRERLKTATSILRHDITNDLTVIKSAVDIYREERDESMIDEIEKRVWKSIETIQNQRDQVEFLDSHAELDEYDIEQVARDVIKNYPDIKITVTGKSRAYADKAIYSVFENIISNAIMHSKSTKLDIDITCNNDICEIRFTDYGIGIPDEIKDKIFDEGFHYGESGHTGIGLYIVKCTVEEYDGDVFVEDNKPQGAVFVIRLKRTIER
ncbi:MAG: PAS domain-containing protein [Candidatus Cloacimonetes bacterium]|nr:PAS domain-containing protein [Candidatus Cloacimonadota bacterium]